MHVLFYLENIL